METHGDLEEPNEVWIIFKLDDLNGFILDFYYFPSKQYDNDIQMGMHNIIVFVLWIHVELTLFCLLIFFTIVIMIFTAIIKYLNNNRMPL